MIGASIPRREDARLLTGQGRFADDLQRDAQVWLSFVRSPHARAMIDAIRTGAAEAQPGVLGVFTAADLVEVDYRPLHAVVERRGNSGHYCDRNGVPCVDPLRG